MSFMLYMKTIDFSSIDPTIAVTIEIFKMHSDSASSLHETGQATISNAGKRKFIKFPKK